MRWSPAREFVGMAQMVQQLHFPLSGANRPHHALATSSTTTHDIFSPLETPDHFLLHAYTHLFIYLLHSFHIMVLSIHTDMMTKRGCLQESFFGLDWEEFLPATELITLWLHILISANGLTFELLETKGNSFLHP